MRDNITTRPESAEQLRKTVHSFASILGEAGWMPESVVDRIEIIEKPTAPEDDKGLLLPLDSNSSGGANLTMYWDILDRYAEEIPQHLVSVDSKLIDKLPTSYIAATALGALAIKKQINNHNKIRTAKYFSDVRDVFSDISDINEFLVDVYGSDPRNTILGGMLDKNVMEINSLRAGLTVMRSAIQDVYGTDFITDDIVNASMSSFLKYAQVEGASYMEAAEKIYRDRQKGIEVFNYAIPEWLVVLSFPLKPDKVDVILR